MSLATNISDVVTSIATAIKGIRTWTNGNDGTGVSRLDTTATTLVDAINEVKAVADGAAGGGATINDSIESTTTVYSSSKTQDQIDAAVSGLVGGAPGALDTLNELAAAINDDASYAATITTQLGAKAPLASPTFTGTPAAPTATAGTNTTQLATTAFVTGAISTATPAASATVAGKVELATDAEVQAGTDTTRAVTPAGLASEIGDYETTTFVATFNAGLA